MLFEVSLRTCPRFLEDLGRLAKGHPKLKELTKKKLEHLAHDPIGLGDRIQAHPLCFKARVGGDHRLIYTLRDNVLIPLMLYAKNEHEDVPLRQLLQVMDMVTRRAQGDR